MPLFTQKRSPRENERYFNRRWSSAAASPWGNLADDPIERRKAELLSVHTEELRTVLDCGCGGGDFLALVADKASFERVVGVDIADKAVERARASGLYAQVVRGHLGEACRDLDERFDLLMFGEILYYLPDYQEVLAYCVDQRLAPGGHVFIAVAVGRDYFRERDVETMRRVLASRGLVKVTDSTIDYTFLGIPRRRLWVFPQAYKAVLIYRHER